MLLREPMSELAKRRAFVKELIRERALEGREDTPDTEDEAEAGLLMMKICRLHPISTLYVLVETRWKYKSGCRP